MTTQKITTVFLDIGGVLLTNGWDHIARQRAANRFHLEYEEMNERHHLTFDTYEEGKLSLDEYLNRVVFYETRTFARKEFIDFMYAQSQPHSDMIHLIKDIKNRHHLEVGAISNEGRELTEFRIQNFDLKSFIDFFVSSCFVHFRKPDEDIFKIALDIAQVYPQDAVYIEDRPMFVDIAHSLGINAIAHRDFETTKRKLAEFGLS
jgi:putative hydrolase of the HAD superfamily